MKLRLLSVGKPRAREEISLHDRYAARFGQLGVSYEAISVADVQAGGRFSDDHVRQREARNVLDRYHKDGARGTLIALHERGDLLRTQQLADQLERWATPVGTFVVGGPLGLHHDVLDRAERIWSLSPLTFPHELVRALVAEQLYRALTILRGTPYHK